MKSEEVLLALRYTLGHRRSRLANFITLVSALGLVLGVSLLITVLSVMNGFDREMRERILMLLPHVRLTQSVISERPNWQTDMETILGHPQVLSASPFTELEVLFRHRGQVEPGLLYAFDPELEQAQTNSGFSRLLGEDLLKEMQSQQGLVLGAGVANRLGVSSGDQLVTLVFQRDKQQLQAASFQVVSVFHTGTEMDQRLGLLSFGQLRNISGQSDTPEGMRVQIQDVFSARSVARDLQGGLPMGYGFSTWQQTHGNLYEAIQMSRYLVALIVMLILVIAAFNLVATLIIASADKQSEIAILKTLGARPMSLARVFAMQGMFIGTLGSVVGGGIGALFSLYLTEISLAVEGFFGFKILSTEVYPLDYLPSFLHWGQLAFVVGVSIFLSVLASVYPAWKVSRVEPSAVLRYE